MNTFDGLRREDYGAVGTRHAEALGNVPGAFLRREGVSPAAQRNALAKLAEHGLIQFLLEFRLAGEHDLEQLLRRGFEVGKEANLLKDLWGVSLRLVDNEHGG